MAPAYNAKLGDNCHMKGNGYIPVCVVTDIAGKILIRNIEPPGVTKWLVTKAKVTVNRFWSSSTALVQCTINADDLSRGFPEILGTRGIAGFGNRTVSAGGKAVPSAEPALMSVNYEIPLRPTVEVCIYLGYIDTLRPVTEKDLQENRLLRVFVGGVDTITTTGTNRNGTNLLIQVRDRMKYLMDSLGTYNSDDNTRSLSSTSPLLTEVKATQEAKGLSRADVILAIARRSVGDLRDSKAVIGDAILQGPCSLVRGVGIDSNIKDTAASGSTTPDDSLKAYAKYDSNSKWVGLLGASTKNGRLPYPGLKFNILTGRKPYSAGAITSNFQVSERVPIEFIKYLANQEPWPTEMFADHRSGEYWYVNRGSDISGFSDPLRFNRTYYYRLYPNNVVPDPRQMCLSFREERSSIGLRTNIIVTNQKGSESRGSILTTHLISVPPTLQSPEGRPLAYPAAYYTVVDPSATDAVSVGALAIKYARQLSKDLRAATCKVVGDPSLCPGEALQVAGSPLVKFDPVKLNEDRELLTRQIDAFVGIDSSIEQQLKFDGQPKTEITKNPNLIVKETPPAGSTPVVLDQPFEAKVSGGSTEVIKGAQQLCNLAFDSGQPIETVNALNFKPAPETVWRVEGLTHLYNDSEEGYYTELALLSPF